QPLLVGAAVTAKTARWMGSWADGLITVHQPFNDLKKVVEGFRENGGEGKPVYLKVQLSYAATDEEALKGAHDQWRTNIFSGTVLGDLSRVEQFDALGEFVQPEEMHGMVRITSNMQKHIDWIKQDMELGFDKIILHNVNREQERFINDFGEKFLPLFN
ncbi:MAG TPA: LLM class F420-dependent oxidoreductase, partial [Flavisolibacter sp.]|nr:LLM class F420-dependent oxidoreductase [Flavisolibacter sp.]